MSKVPRGIWLFAAIFTLAASLPYIVGVFNAPPGGAFTGNALEQARVDYNSHIAKMQIGLRGDWGDQIMFTPEDHPGILTKTFYIALGQAARIFGLSLEFTYHLARIVCTFGMAITIWLFVAHFVEGNRAHWTAFLLATITGGAGWLLYLVAPEQTASLAPIEFWLFDAYTFLAALTFPHFAAAIILLLAFFLVIDHWVNEPNWKDIILASILSLLIGWIQPFDLLLTALVTAALTLRAMFLRQLKWRQAFALSPVVLAHLIPTIYVYLALESHPVWQAFAAQNITLSPPPIYYLLGYGWLLIPAISGIVIAWRRRDERPLLLILWVILTAILIYAPLQTQRRFLMGVQIPLAILASVGLEATSQWWTARGRSPVRWRMLLAAGLLLSTVSHVLVLASTTMTANPAARPLLFLTADDLAALDWMRDQPPETVTLAAFSSGGRIPAYTGRRVYLGHWIETMDFPTRQAQVRAFFDPTGMSDDERIELLRAASIDFVWRDPATTVLGAWSPEEAGFLRGVFVSETVTIYEVLP